MNVSGKDYFEGNPERQKKKSVEEKDEKGEKEEKDEKDKDLLSFLSQRSHSQLSSSK